MMVSLHKNARTTPAIRKELAESREPVSVLAKRYNITEATVRKWKKRTDFTDRSHTAHRLQTTMNELQEAVVVHLRRSLLLSLDDLLYITREFIHPDVSRSGLDRCLRRHGVGSLRDMLPKTDKPPVGRFKDYDPGFVHIDVKYLPQMADQTRRSYLFVAIDRATRWVFVKVYRDKTAQTAKRFLKALHEACPLKITRILTDNGKEFTDRLFGARERDATNAHEFDALCTALGIEHRLTPVRRPQTNPMVERFNGRVADVLRTHHFNSKEDLTTTLERYAHIYNHHLPQSVLGSKPPIQAMKDWYESHPHLFKRRPYNHRGRDKYDSMIVMLSEYTAMFTRSNIRYLLVNCVLCIGISFNTTVVFGQSTVDERKEARFAAFQQLSDKVVQKGHITWDSQAGHVKSLVRTAISVPGAHRNNASDIADKFFEQYRLALGLERQSISVQHVHTNQLPDENGGGGKILRYRQYFNEVPIVGSGYTIGIAGAGSRFRNEGDVYYLVGKVFPEIDLSTTPTVSSDAATMIIESTYNSPIVEFGPSLVIFVDNRRDTPEFILSYEFQIRLPDDMQLVHVDALTGEVVSSETQAGDVKNHSTKNTNDKNSQQFTLFGLHGDKHDWLQGASVSCSTSPCADVYQVDPEASSITNSSLNYLNGNNELNGLTVKVVNVNEGDSTAQAVGGDFEFSTSTWEFDQTNVYYHLTQSRLDLLENPERKITAKTHGGDIRAFPDEFSPYDDYIVLDSATTGKFNNSHLSGAVVVHEYWHLLSMFRNNELNDTVRSRALWEGISDFAGILYRSMRGGSSTVILDYLVVDEDLCTRNVVNYLNFNDWNTYPHPTDLDGCYEIAGRGDEYDAAPIMAGAL